MKTYLNKKQAASIANVSLASINRALAAGTLKAHKPLIGARVARIVLIAQDDIVAWVEGKANAPCSTKSIAPTNTAPTHTRNQNDPCAHAVVEQIGEEIT